MSVKVILKNVRLAFVDSEKTSIFEPRLNDKGQKQWGCAAILPPDHEGIKAIQEAEKAACKEVFGDKASATYSSIKAANKLALKDGNAKTDIAGYEGNFFINMNSKVAPKLKAGDRVTDVTKEMDLLYSGVYANVILEIWAQNNAFGKRVNAQLKGIMFAAHGERLGGGGSAAKDEEFNEFDAVETPEGEDEF